MNWDEDFLRRLLDPPVEHHRLVPSLSSRHLEMGDLLILNEFRRLRTNLDASVVDVDIWTADSALRAETDAIRSGPPRKRLIRQSKARRPRRP